MDREYEEEMKILVATEDDPEMTHIKADEILCSLLIEKGETEVVKLFRQVKKWYI